MVIEEKEDNLRDINTSIDDLKRKEQREIKNDPYKLRTASFRIPASEIASMFWFSALRLGTNTIYLAKMCVCVSLFISLNPPIQFKYFTRRFLAQLFGCPDHLSRQMSE